MSCSSDNSKDSNSTNVESALEIQNSENHKIAYGMLTEQEQYDYWNTFLSGEIRNDNTLSTAEIELIQAVIDELDPQLFSDTNNSLRDGFKNIFVPDFLNRAQTVMSRGRIQHLFYGFRQPGTVVGGVKPTCDCNQGSMFGCGTSDNCSTRTCKDPDIDPNDCGFLLMYPCDGLCNF